MIQNILFKNIRAFADRLLENPLLSSMTLELIVRYTVDFFGILQVPEIYIDRTDTVEIREHRGLLPCSLIAVNLVRDCKTGLCLKAISGTFENRIEQPAFRTKGSIIFTTFANGAVEVSYLTLPVDEEGYPMVIDDPIFEKTLESYIKKIMYVRFLDLGQINQASLQNAQQEWCWNIGLCVSHFSIPSVSEMQSIANDWGSLIMDKNKFYSGFATLGNKEIYKRH